MNHRPFSCAYEAPEHPSETRIELICQRGLPDVLKRVGREFGTLMKAVALVGSQGGFSGELHHPDRSHVILREGQPERVELSWSFRHENVGAELAFVLENLARSMRLRISHLEGVTIKTGLTHRMAGAVPGEIKGYRPLPFEYVYEVMSPTVVVDAEFTDRQEPRSVEGFRGVFDAWYAVAAAGGFADDQFLPTGEVAIFVENELQITSVGMQVVYAGAQVGESGFDVLTNTLAHFHSALARLERVEIA